MDHRLIDVASVAAERANRPVHRARASNPIAALGLRYERRLRRQLLRHKTLGHFLEVEHNPWFLFRDRFGASACAPDFLLWPNPNQVIIVEVKYTWVPSAALKLAELYRPVVEHALGVVSLPLIICKNLTPEAPPATHTLREAMASPSRLLHYIDNGALLW